MTKKRVSTATPKKVTPSLSIAKKTASTPKASVSTPISTSVQLVQPNNDWDYDDSDGDENYLKDDDEVEEVVPKKKTTTTTLKKSSKDDLDDLLDSDDDDEDGHSYQQQPLKKVVTTTTPITLTSNGKKKSPSSNLVVEEKQGGGQVIEKKRRTKSIGGAITKEKSDAATTTTTSTKQTKRKSTEPKNIFQTDRFKDDEEDDDEDYNSDDDDTVEQRVLKLHKRKDYDTQDNDFKPTKEVKKKVRYSTVGVQTELQRDKDKEVEKKKKAEEEKLAEKQRKQKELEESQRRKKEMEDKEKERQRLANERLQKLTSSNKLYQPTTSTATTTTSTLPRTTIPKPTPAPASFSTPGSKTSSFGSDTLPNFTSPPILPSNREKHVYPKTPISKSTLSRGGTGAGIGGFPYTADTPQPNPSKPIFVPSSNDSISFDTDDHIDFDSSPIDNSTLLDQHEQEFQYQQYYQQLHQQQQQSPQHGLPQQDYNGDDGIEHRDDNVKRSRSSIALATVTFLYWFILLFMLFGFYYNFSDVIYCDTDTLPQYKDGKYSCMPCPERGICYRGSFTSCFDGYVKQGDQCIVDPNKVETMSTVLNKVDYVLRVHKGKFECGVTEYFDMSFERLQVEFDRLFWIKTTDIVDSFNILISYLNVVDSGQDKKLDVKQLNSIDQKLVNQISSTYNQEDGQYYYHTDSDSIRPLWCQSFLTVKSIVMGYLPVIISLVTFYVLYRYYQYNQKSKQKEILIVDECYNHLVRILQHRAINSEIPWISEILLKADIIGEDRSKKALKTWDMVLEKVYNNIRIFVTPRLVHGESQQTFEWRDDGSLLMMTPMKQQQQQLYQQQQQVENDDDLNNSIEQHHNVVSENAWN